MLLILLLLLSAPAPQVATPEPCRVRPSWEYYPGMHIVIIVAGRSALPQVTPTPSLSPTAPTGVGLLADATATPTPDRTWHAYAHPTADLYVVNGYAGDISLDRPFTISYAPPSRAQSDAPFTLYSCPPGARPFRLLLPLLLRPA
jgi:hypothetical protein